jgi:hypothetical protein
MLSPYGEFRLAESRLYTPELCQIAQVIQWPIRIEVKETEIYRDLRFAQDLALVARGQHYAAARVRNMDRHQVEWRKDVTIRSFANGAPTELEKLNQGLVPYYLYCWARSLRIEQWICWDVTKAAAAGLFRPRVSSRFNGDGTGFVTVQTNDLERCGSVLAASWDRPNQRQSTVF